MEAGRESYCAVSTFEGEAQRHWRSVRRRRRNGRLKSAAVASVAVVAVVVVVVVVVAVVGSNVVPSVWSELVRETQQMMLCLQLGFLVAEGGRMGEDERRRTRENRVQDISCNYSTQSHT